MLGKSEQDLVAVESPQQEKENNRLRGILEEMKHLEHSWHEKYEQEMSTWKKNISEKTKEIEQLKQLLPSKKTSSFWSPFKSKTSSTYDLTALESSIANMQERLVQFEFSKEQLEEHFAIKENEWLQLLNSQEVLLEAYESKSKHQEELLENYTTEQQAMQEEFFEQENELQLRLTEQEQEFQARMIDLEQDYQLQLAEQEGINSELLTMHTQENQELLTRKEQEFAAELDELHNMIKEYDQKIKNQQRKEEMLTKQLRKFTEKESATKNRKYQQSDKNIESSTPEAGFTFLRNYAPLPDNYNAQF